MIEDDDLGDAEDARGLAQLVARGRCRARRRRTSAGSLTDPRSPREAHSSTTRAPASASRASVPPHASDSSSGCAKTARTVRPTTPSDQLSSATVRLDDLLVDRHVLVDHALDAEARDGALADAPAIEREHARQAGRHLVEVVEDDAGDAVVDDLADGAAIERGDRRAAGHRFGEHQPERLARLNRVEQRARAAVQLHLGVDSRPRRDRRSAMPSTCGATFSR